MVAMLRKWQTQYESYHQLLSWLQCDIDQESHGMVGCLWCELCMDDQQNIQVSQKILQSLIE